MASQAYTHSWYYPVLNACLKKTEGLASITPKICLTFFLSAICLAVVFVTCKIRRVGHNHMYTVYIRYFWQVHHHIYGHKRCIYTVLANPKNKYCFTLVRNECLKRSFFHLDMNAGIPKHKKREQNAGHIRPEAHPSLGG